MTGRRASAGYTLIEATFAIALGITLGAIASPQLLAAVDEARTAGGVRYMTTRLQQARMEAVVRSTDVGLQFVAVPGGFSYGVYVDGNGNGIRTTEIQRGVDRRIAAVEQLSDRVSGVEFGVLPGLPPVDAGSLAPGSDPIKLGASNILTFTPLGTSSSGSLYVLGRRSSQYVIRIVGETGKARVLKFDARTRQWKPS